MITDGQREESINHLLETFNADAAELTAFLENPRRYLEMLGAINLEDISEDELRKMVQNHVER